MTKNGHLEPARFLELCWVMRLGVLEWWYDVMGTTCGYREARLRRLAGLKLIMMMMAALTGIVAGVRLGRVGTGLLGPAVAFERGLERLRLWLLAFIEDPDPWTFGPRPWAEYPVGGIIGPDPVESPGTAALRDVVSAQKAMDDLLVAYMTGFTAEEHLSEKAQDILSRMRRKRGRSRSTALVSHLRDD